MLPAHEAEALILNLVRPFVYPQNAEIEDLRAATGRILAAEVTSQLDFPHWDNSAMDGYAVRYADVQCCSAEHPVNLTIIEEIPAGYQPQKTIQPGQAARILTGSMMPAGADTVVMQEETQREGDQVTIFKPPVSQAFVRQRAAFYQAGTTLLSTGTRLTAPEIAVLAAAQCTQVEVFRRPRVAVLSTGSELVAPDQPLHPGQVVDSNQYALASLVTSAGAEPVLLGIVPDQPEAIRQTIVEAVAKADMVLSSGGVSVGDYDYVDRILLELGAEIWVRSVAIKPGKPLTVAQFAEQGVLYFGLPGNPVSALVTFWRFVQPALGKLSGLTKGWYPTFVTGRSTQELRSDGKRESYLWGRVKLVDGEYEFQLAGGSHSSGNLINLANTNALAVVPIGQQAIGIGEPVRILLIS